MRTNVLNDLSNVVKKGTSRVQVGYKVEEETLAGSWAGVGRISEEGAIEHPLSTHSAPFGIRWKPAGEKGSTRVWKHVAMIFAVLVMSMANVGMAWGAYDVPANGTVTLSQKVNNEGRFNVEASGVYHFRLADGYSWSSGDGIKTQSNQCGVIFYLDASTEIEVGIKHTESKNAHDVTVHVYSIPESEYKQFDDNKAGAAESNRTFSTGPSTSSDNSFTISVTAESKTFKGTKTLAAGYYAVVPVGEKSKTFFNSIKFTSGGVTKPTFSPATGSSLVKSTGTVTLTSSGNTVYYKWSQTDNQYASGAGATLAGAADGSDTSPVNATAPSTAGTWYLYAVAKNGGDYSNVVKATYTITNPTHTLTWNLDGGTATGGTAAGAVAEGATLTAPTVTKVGYDFAGWSPSVPATMPAADATYTATWTKVYASGTYNFYNNATLGTAPNQKTITTDYADYNAFRIDNIFFSAINMAYEGGSTATGSDYKGWKIKKNNATIKFFVENDSEVTISIGRDNTLNVSYTNTAGASQTPTITSGNSSTYSVKGGTMVTLTMSTSSTITIKQIAIAAIAGCTAPNHVDISGNYHFFPGETLALTATAYSTAGTSDPIAAGDITGYQWQKFIGSDWENIVGETSATYTKANATTSDVGQYRCVVSTGATCSTTSDTFNAKCLQLYVYWDDKSDKCNLPFTKVDGTHATVNVSLENGSYTYYYKVTDGCGNWWGNDGTMTSGNCSGWNLNVNNHCGLTTTKAAAYTFNLTYNAGVDAFSMSVVYPSSVQVGGYNLYFANDERNWSNIHYRIGRNNYNSKAAMTLVPGTANLYQTTTIYYESDGGFEAWHIANNGGWSGGNSIYKTKTSDSYAITNATRFEGAPVPSTGLTVIPGSDHSTGGEDQNNNCEFYSYTTVPGMKTQNVAISPYSNGTITVNYTNTSNVASTLTSGNADLAHSVILTSITAVANTGYDASAITINGGAYSANYVVTGATTIAATFSPQVYTINYYDLGGGAFSGSHADGHPTSHTYNTATTLKGATLSNYTWDGWYTASDCASGKVTSLGATAYTASPNLYAKFTQAITLDREGASTGSTSVTATYKSATLPSITNPSKTGYTFGGWYTGDDGTGNLVINTSGALQESVSGYTGTGGIWTSSSARTLHAKWTAKQTTITIDANSGNHGSTTPGSVTATWGSALPSFTAAAGVSGYSLTGYYTDATSGTKIINADGTLVASTSYADGSSHWNSEAATLTLYAQYEEEAVACYDFTPATSGSAPSIGDVISGTGSGGTMVAGNGQSYTANGLKFESSTDSKYVTVTLDNNLKAGSIIAVTMWMDGTKDNRGLNLQTSSGTTKVQWKFTADSQDHQFSYTVEASDGLINTNVFRLARINDVYLKSVTVSNCGDAACTEPTTTLGNGAYTVGGSALDLSTLISSSQGGGAITYSVTNANGTGATIAGTSFTATSAGTATVTATQAADGDYCEKVMDATITVSAAPAGTTYYLVTSTAQLNTTDTYVIMDDGKAAMMGVASGSNPYLNAITSGFTVAADKSTVTVTSSDVNTLTLKSESDAWNLFGKDSHYITTNSTVSGNLYGNATSGSSTDDFVFSFADGKVTIKRNTTTDYHIYYSSGTGFNQSTSSTNIRLYTSNSTPVYTVTYDLNGGTGTVPTNRPEKSGTSITLASSTGLTKAGFTFDGWLCSVNSTKYAAGASYTMTAANTTFTAQWEAVSGYTVTYKYNGATSGATPTSATGASVTLPTPTRTGYELDGWYTTAGTKAGIGGASYEPEADITLYARWQVACDGSGTDSSIDDVAATGYTTYKEKGGSNVVFTSAPSIGFKYKDADGNIVNNSTTSVVRNNAYKCQISSDSSNKGSIKTNNAFSNVDSISFYFAASDKNGCKIAVWCSTDDFSADSTSLLSATTYADNNSEFKLKTLAIPSGKKASALRFKFRFTVTSSGKTSYIDSLKIYSSTASSGTCYHVYYHGNGAESGFVSDTTSYSDGAKATVLSYNDSRYPLTREDYEFRGWATSAGGSAAYSDGQQITIDGADVHLYAVWAAETDALVTWTMKTNTGDWTATATSTTDGTNIGSIATARTAGGTGSYEGATAKVTMADAEVTGSAAPSNSANFTFTIKSSTKQVEINKFDCQVFNVSSGNRTYKAQISDAAGNVYNSTNTVAVSAEASLTDASFVFGSGKILRGDVTIRVYAWKTSGSPTEFRMGPDVKFYGTVDDYACATPSEPTISGVSEYVPGQTITLTASHDGENYDNLTTYTWYKGDTWGSKSQVQAAATGAAGYTFTKASCAAGDAGKYWCEVANGTCNAHNSVEYSVIVYPAYSITWELNGGTWGGVEHKDSYTRFDEDYTLPIPTKDGFVFAGWYEASDFSGLPTSLIETNSIGDKSFFAKWGSAVTATWTVTKVDDKLYRGGGGYSVKAVIDQTAWNESYKDQLELTATEGVTLKNIVASVVSSHVQVTADFDITTGLAADATEITFTLDVPADGTYAPAELTHDEDLTSCAGSSTVWDFTTNDFLNGGTWSTSSGAENKAYATDGTTILKYYAGGSGDEWDSSNEQLKTKGATDFTSGTGKKQMTKKYFLFPTLSGKGTISVVYGTTNSTLKIYEATSTNIYGLDPIITLTSSSPTSSTYTFSSEKKYYMTMESNKVYFKRITFTASSGGITPTLSWSPALASDGDWDSGNNRLNKETGDVDFTFVAVQNKNSLGAITYSSNNPSVATVNAAGTVHIVGAAGDATITATLAASGCFEEAAATYNIHVEDNCIDEPGTIAWTDRGCSGIEMTVSGHTALAGVSYQWYKVGTPDETVGTNSATFTATEAGEYYVVVTNTGTDHCPMASTNTVKVASKAAATATKIVDSWYVKNGRRTPDVALVQTTGATDFIVKNGSTVIWNSDSTTTTGFGGCGFHMGTDGIIYLNGTKDNGDATTDLTAGDVTLKITANDGCGSSASELSITIHCQEATTYKEIAFVVDGDKGEGFDKVTSGHADGTELYEYLDTVGTAAGKRLFQLTEQNIYSTTDEKAIRQHYSQYDAILITDDPSTNKVPNKEDYKTGGYVNAFGTIVDVRPILTMEAYVSALENWSAKGIAGNPSSPNPRQYEMRLECKDHEIYGAGLPDPEDGTNVWEEVVDGETFRHVILVDSTLGIYNGVKYNQETKGNEKPALQGFTGEAAGSLLGLGRILEGTLQAAIERQEEPAARLLVFGINAKALHETCALTDEGKTVIKNILVYLLKTNMEEVDDCSNYFTGKFDNDWSKAGNWSKSALPSSEAKVRILAPCVISGSHPHVAQVAIVSSGKSGIRETATGSANCNGKLTINADGALIVGGDVLAAEAPHFAHNDLMPTTVEDLIINTNGSGQAALIFDNDEAETKATVNLYSLGRKEDGAYQFQYFAVPMEYVDVNPAFYGSNILTYVWHENSGWERRGYYTGLSAFEGVGITKKDAGAKTYTMRGNLTSTADREIVLTHGSDGQNIVGNSWLAPINIASLRTALADDANIVDKTVYIYCTGNDGTSVHSGDGETAGQWLAIPINAAGWDAWTGLKVIPAMQAFCIKANTETTLALNYKDHVRSTADTQLNEKLRAPKRRTEAEAETEGIDLIRIRVADSKTHTDLYLFEGEPFSEEFDNGWEAEYMSCDGRSAKLYAETTIGQMAVVAQPEYEGTVLGFAPGKETEYTFTFSGPNKDYYLNDLKLKKSTLISEDESYFFTFEEGDTNRFYISKTRIDAPAITTGTENTGDGVKARKVIVNDKLYIILNGKVYSAEGMMVK